VVYSLHHSIRIGLIIFLFFFFIIPGISQERYDKDLSRADFLRGYLNEFRSCFDVQYYDLSVRVRPQQQAITGYNTIHLEAIGDFDRIQLDLFSNMTIDSVVYDGQLLPFERELNAFFIGFPILIRQGSEISLTIYYHGIPVKAKHPPWDGGFVWSRDSLHRNWIGVSCQGIGASLWWPNKDHLSDRPEGMRISLEVPEGLKGISNGKLQEVVPLQDGYNRWIWEVTYPINNYNVSINVGEYAHIRDSFDGLDGRLNLDYYVLDYNRDKAAEQFRQVQPMFTSYEKFFGPYPFYRDGYKLIETPYYGMEHQSGIAYGNDFRNNEYDFDYIIIHESGHEYWGNCISIQDLGELWVHESFTTYMESLFMEYFHGKQVALNYLSDQRLNIENMNPMLGPLNVNYDNWIDTDIYYKGTWMLHSIRNTVNNDSIWFNLLHNTFQHFKYKSVTSSEIVAYINAGTEYDLMPVFDHFLTRNNAPVLRIREKRKKDHIKLVYSWDGVGRDFNMPAEIHTESETLRIFPAARKQKKNLPPESGQQLNYYSDLFYYELNRK